MNNDWLPIPPLPDLIALHEQVLKPLRPARVVGVALNTFDLGDAVARSTITETARATGLPCTDPVRYGPTPLIDAVLALHRATQQKD